jgi:hypothetical protein
MLKAKRNEHTGGSSTYAHRHCTAGLSFAILVSSLDPPPDIILDVSRTKCLVLDLQVPSSPPFNVFTSSAAVQMFAWSVSGRSINSHTSPTLAGEEEGNDVGHTMFHTFQSSNGMRSPGGDTDSSGKPSRPPGSRRISTSNACVECRRRKIRCDGSKPCGQCQWYQHPEVSRHDITPFHVQQG